MLIILADRLSFNRHTYLSMIRFFRQVRYSKTKDTFHVIFTFWRYVMVQKRAICLYSCTLAYYIQICCCNRVCVHMHARCQSGYQEGLELPEKFRQTYYKFQIVRLPKISLGPGLLHGKQSYSRETILDPHTTNLETESTLLMFFKSNINH